MQRGSYAALAGLYGSVSAGTLVYAAALPGSEYELANALPASAYLATTYPNLAKVSQGRMGQVVETSPNTGGVSASWGGLKVINRPGTDEFYCHGDNSNTIYYKSGFFGTWSARATAALNRAGGGATLTTRAILFVDGKLSITLVNGPTSFVNVSTPFNTAGAYSAGEGNGRLVIGGNNYISYGNNDPTPTFTAVSLPSSGTWIKVYWISGNTWIAFNTVGNVAKSTDNGTTWTIYTSITNKTAPAYQAVGWGQDYAIDYDVTADKFYIGTANGVYVATSTTVTTGWTLEYTPPAGSIISVEVVNYGVLAAVLESHSDGGGGYIVDSCRLAVVKRGSTTWRVISLNNTKLLFKSAFELSDGFIGLESGYGTHKMANGINSFDPARDLSPGGDLLPYLRLK